MQNDLIIAVEKKQKELIRFYHMSPHGKMNDERGGADLWYICLIL